MNIFHKIHQIPKLTSNEKTLVEFIEKHPQQFLETSIQEVSKVCFVSPSTVYRLCKKLNLSGLSEFKVHLSASLSTYQKENEHLNYDYPITQNETQYQIANKLKEVYDQTLISTLNLFDFDQLRLIASAMSKAKQIDIYTSAGNIFFAENFKFQMQEIGITVNVPLEEYHQCLCASSSTKDHLAFVISFGGRGNSVEHICNILKKNKTPILLIGAGNQHPLQKYATYRLNLCHYENHYNKISSFSTRLSLLYILDNIYTCFFKLNYDENIENKIHYYKLLNPSEDL